MKVYLCGKDGCCPAVEFSGDRVLIGEEGNLATLSREEWNALRSKILAGEL